MKDRINKVCVITCVLTLGLISGCTITTTRNQYYGCPDPGKISNQNESLDKHVADTLTSKEAYPLNPNLF